MAYETVETTTNEADTLGINDFARIALRRNFEDGEYPFDHEATTSLLGDMGDDVGTVLSRREVSGGASALDVFLYDDVSALRRGSLDRAHMQSRELLSEEARLPSERRADVTSHHQSMTLVGRSPST